MKRPLKAMAGAFGCQVLVSARRGRFGLPIDPNIVVEHGSHGISVDAGRTLEIGGRDVLTYAGMMKGYAQARGLKRYLLAVPVLTPRLSSYWVHFVTPIPAKPPTATPSLWAVATTVRCAVTDTSPPALTSTVLLTSDSTVGE